MKTLDELVKGLNIFDKQYSDILDIYHYFLDVKVNHFCTLVDGIATHNYNIGFIGRSYTLDFTIENINKSLKGVIVFKQEINCDISKYVASIIFNHAGEAYIDKSDEDEIFSLKEENGCILAILNVLFLETNKPFDIGELSKERDITYLSNAFASRLRVDTD